MPTTTAKNPPAAATANSWSNPPLSLLGEIHPRGSPLPPKKNFPKKPTTPKGTVNNDKSVSFRPKPTLLSSYSKHPPSPRSKKNSLRFILSHLFGEILLYLCSRKGQRTKLNLKNINLNINTRTLIMKNARHTRAATRRAPSQTPEP